MRVKDYKFYEQRGCEGLPEFHQIVYRFPNGYGASVVYGKYSYGIELAVVHFKGDEWFINYWTPITDDVLVYLNYRELKKALVDISELTNVPGKVVAIS